MDSPLITLAIVSHQQQDLVQHLLRSLVDVNSIVSFQIVLIENVSGTARIDLDDFSFPIQYVENAKQLGFSSNINKAYELGGRLTEYFCILNPDIRFTSDIFPALLASIREENIDLISPLVTDNQGTIQDSFRPTPTFFEMVLRFLGQRKYSYTYEELPEYSFPDWFGAMFALMRSRVFEDVGGFDPKFRMYMEDVDFCVRARQKGFKIAVKKSTQVIHDGQRDSHKKLRLFVFHMISAIKFFTSRVYWQEQKND